MCPPHSNEQPLTKGLCPNHYQLSLKLNSMNKQNSKDVKDDGLGELIDILDAIFSKYVRLKYADENGFVRCFVTGYQFHWTALDAGHFISRSCMFLRWDLRNVKPQAIISNRFRDGDISSYAHALEKESPGIVDILTEEANTIYKYSRHELNELIRDYRDKVNGLLKKINNG